ncbi:MAG: putative O-phosphotransferase [Chlamydiia bacterium]|nr:putative O-phosphotransferase [Chlamydiia bacterium]
MRIKEGIIIILNGPSSVGKSSLQKALQGKSKEFFVRIGIDTFFDALLPEPDLTEFERDKKLDQETGIGEYIRGIRFEDVRGKVSVPLIIGPAGDRVMRGMHRAIGEYAKVGCNVIVDYILYKPEYMDDLKSSLAGRRAFFIGVHAPLEVIEQREQRRGTSPVGHARSHYETCHKNVAYDLELNAETSTPDQLADQVLDFMKQKLLIVNY